MTKSSKPHQTLEMEAFDVARYFHEHGGYGSSENRAIRALRKRAPGWNKDVYVQLFQATSALLLAAKQLVKENADALWKTWNVKKLSFEMCGLDEQLAIRFPNLCKETCRQAITWVFYWHHVR